MRTARRLQYARSRRCRASLRQRNAEDDVQDHLQPFRIRLNTGPYVFVNRNEKATITPSPPPALHEQNR